MERPSAVEEALPVCVLDVIELAGMRTRDTGAAPVVNAAVPDVIAAGRRVRLPSRQKTRGSWLSRARAVAPPDGPRRANFFNRILYCCGRPGPEIVTC